LKNIAFRHFIPAIIWFFIVLVLICMPQQDVPEPQGWGEWLKKMHIDKFVHAGMFGMLSLLWMLPFRRSSKESAQKRKWFFIIALSTSFWGLATECIQIALPPRTFDWLDWAADASGVLLMWMISKKYLLSSPKVHAQNLH